MVSRGKKKSSFIDKKEEEKKIRRYFYLIILKMNFKEEKKVKFVHRFVFCLLL